MSGAARRREAAGVAGRPGSSSLLRSRLGDPGSVELAALEQVLASCGRVPSVAERPVLLSPFGGNGDPEVDRLSLEVELALDQLNDAAQVLDAGLQPHDDGDRHPMAGELAAGVQGLREGGYRHHR